MSALLLAVLILLVPVAAFAVLIAVMWWRYGPPASKSESTAHPHSTFGEVMGGAVSGCGRDSNPHSR